MISTASFMLSSEPAIFHSRIQQKRRGRTGPAIDTGPAQLRRKESTPRVFTAKLTRPVLFSYPCDKDNP